MRAALRVCVKLQHEGPMRPSLEVKSKTILPPVPPRIVLLMTLAIISPSPGFIMVPRDPPLKERKPAIRIMPPIPTSCRNKFHLFQISY